MRTCRWIWRTIWLGGGFSKWKDTWSHATDVKHTVAFNQPDCSLQFSGWLIWIPGPVADLGTFVTFGWTVAPTKRGPTGQRTSDTRVAARHFPVCGGLFVACCDIYKFTWSSATFSPWRALYAALRSLNFTTLLTYLFPGQKILVRAPHFYRTGPNQIVNSI